MMDGKDILAGEYRKSPVFAGFKTCAPAGHFERYMENAIFRFHKTLFPVILSSFPRRGRRHYIRAVKMFDSKPSMLYTITVGSLKHCCDNFEQNAQMLS